MLRIWAITLDHDKYEREARKCEASHRRAQTAREKPTLRRLASAPLVGAGQRLPHSYDTDTLSSHQQQRQQLALRAPAGAAALREHIPPASANSDTFTLMKFFDVTPELVVACLSGADDTRVDFPFRVSPPEAALIAKAPNPPAALLLVGRSGTGKTACAVYRLWSRWLLARQAGTPLAALFVTASATLRQQVAASFRCLRAATFTPAEAAAADAAEASNAPLASLLAVPQHRFPLFLTSSEYLRLLDASLPSPFLAPRPSADGDLLADDGDDDDDFDDVDLDGADIEIDLAGGAAGGDAADDADASADAGFSAPLLPRRRRAGARKEVTYAFFTHTLWRKMTTKAQRDTLRPSLVYSEIRSYLAGSAQALASPGQRLPLDAYLTLGRKRAPNFSEAGRREVYPLFERYTRLKAQLGRYDVCDLVASLYARLQAGGWRGTPIHLLYRDEVQDFVQAELLLDLRLLADPSGILYSGDTAQTISRGVGFRFDDIRTLFYDESVRRLAAASPGPPLRVPDIDTLALNYRTHAGVLDAAAVCVAALRALYPRSIDALPRERAFFDGASPLLLPALCEDDLSILLSGANRGASSVEFGAHQVILVRSTEAAARLPLALRASGALVMTVPQAKGLEFDDVFLVDFFADSAATSGEWRVLLSIADDLRAPELGLARPSYETAADAALAAAAAAAAEDAFDDGSACGALRPLAPDPSTQVVLCEELKHLYTAITRAKNNVIICDSSVAQRAPFYALLCGLGLARSARTSLHAGGPSASRSGPAEWAARAAALADNEQPALAAQCFAKAGDAPRALAAQAAAYAAQAAAAEEERERRGLYAAAGDAFLTAAAHAPLAPQAALALAIAVAAEAAATARAAADAVDAAEVGAEPPAAAEAVHACITPATAAERTAWLARAANNFIRAAHFETAAELCLSLGQHLRAGQCLMRAGAHRRAAAAFEAGLKATTAATTTSDAIAKLQVGALRAHIACRAFADAAALLERYPPLLRAAAAESIDTDKVLMEAAKAHAAAGRRPAAASALRSLSARVARAERERLLMMCGCFRELAELMPDATAAAALLLTHEGPAVAAQRLRDAVASAPALRARAHDMTLCAAARAMQRADGAAAAAEHVDVAAALWPQPAAATGAHWAEASLMCAVLRRDASLAGAALAAYVAVGSAPGQLAALAAKAALPDASLNFSLDELTLAARVVPQALRALQAVALTAPVARSGADWSLVEQLDVHYGALGLSGAAAAAAVGDGSTAVVLRPEEWRLSAACARVSALLARDAAVGTHPLGPRAAAALAAAGTACRLPAVPPPKPPPPPRAVPWRSVLAVILLDTYASCTAVLHATCAGLVAAADAATRLGHAPRAVDAALDALALPPLHEAVLRDVADVARCLGAPPPDAFPSAGTASASRSALRAAAAAALRAALFPPSLAGGAAPAALDAFAAAADAPAASQRALACAEAVRTWEAQWDELPSSQRTAAHAAALWRVYTMDAPARVEGLRSRVRIARNNAAASARRLGAAASAQPALTVRGEPHSPPLALLLAARDAARAGDAPGAAQAILHFLEFSMREENSAAQDNTWQLPLLELAAGGALSALGAVQPVVAPAAWLSAYK
jgi:hypothetical protein